MIRAGNTPSALPGPFGSLPTPGWGRAEQSRPGLRRLRSDGAGTCSGSLRIDVPPLHASLGLATPTRAPRSPQDLGAAPLVRLLPLREPKGPRRPGKQSRTPQGTAASGTPAKKTPLDGWWSTVQWAGEGDVRCMRNSEPCGNARVFRIDGRILVLPRTGAPGGRPAEALLKYGQTAQAARVGVNAQTGELERFLCGRSEPTSMPDGWYPCIIDQNEELFVTILKPDPVHGAPGAHRAMAGGFPVLFAGELLVQGGVIIRARPASGSYRTPEACIPQARRHPLLCSVPFIGFQDPA
jgi:hypothetical protein